MSPRSSRGRSAGSASFGLFESLESRRLLSGALLQEDGAGGTGGGMALHASTTEAASIVWIRQGETVGTAAVIQGEVALAGNWDTEGDILVYDGDVLVASGRTGTVAFTPRFFEIAVDLPAGGERTLRVVYQPDADEELSAEASITVRTLSSAEDALRTDVTIHWDRFNDFIVTGADGKPAPSGFITIRRSTQWDLSPAPEWIIPVIDGHARWDTYTQAPYRTYVTVRYSGDVNHKPGAWGDMHAYANPVWSADIRTVDGANIERVRTGENAVLKLAVGNYGWLTQAVSGPIEIWQDGRVIATGQAVDGLVRIDLGVLPAGEHVVYARFAGKTVGDPTLGKPGLAYSQPIERITILVSDEPDETPSEERTPTAVRSEVLADGSVRFEFVGLDSGHVQVGIRWHSQEDGGPLVAHEKMIEATLDADSVVVIPGAELPPVGVRATLTPTILRDARNERVVVGTLEYYRPQPPPVETRTLASLNREAGYTEVAFTGPDGQRYTRQLHLPAARWSLRAIADANADGYEDLVWQDAQTGKVIVWNLSLWANIRDMTVLHRGGPWVLTDVRDDNGDGSLDYIWRRSTDNKEAVWFTNPRGQVTGFVIR